MKDWRNRADFIGKGETLTLANPQGSPHRTAAWTSDTSSADDADWRLNLELPSSNTSTMHDPGVSIWINGMEAELNQLQGLQVEGKKGE